MTAHKERLKKLEEFLIPEYTRMFIVTQDIEQRTLYQTKLSELYQERKELYSRYDKTFHRNTRNSAYEDGIANRLRQDKATDTFYSRIVNYIKKNKDKICHRHQAKVELGHPYNHTKLLPDASYKNIRDCNDRGVI